MRDGSGGGGFRGSRNSGNAWALVYNSSSELELELGASSNGLMGGSRLPLRSGGDGKRPSGRSMKLLLATPQPSDIVTGARPPSLSHQAFSSLLGGGTNYMPVQTSKRAHIKDDTHARYQSVGYLASLPEFRQAQ